jgi:class 3 adenylate cyclase/tetratricopeptide (TPR) repeat protein
MTMTCSACGAITAPGARFCASCGAELLACSACGAALGDGQRFCPRCGQPAAARRTTSGETSPGDKPRTLAERLTGSPTALQGERKQVTVLFADLRGSLELLADRDPEEARRVLDPVLTLMVDTAHRYGGTVNQVMGDGVMVLFGAPAAQEDHAVRACHAALEMHAALARHAATVRSTADVDMAMRVGLNSGEVVLRLVDSDLRFEYTAVGRTTHIAARMEQLAAPGTTLITGATRRLAEGYIEVRPRGLVTIRGAAQPEEVYELVGAAPARTRSEAARARWSTRFVDREAELGILRRASERAQGKRGQVVAVVGDPGVGKSRLVVEFLHGHLPDGWAVLDTGAFPHQPTTAYLPIIRMLRQYVGALESDAPEAIRERLEEQVRRIEGVPAILSPLLQLLGVDVIDPAWQDLDPARRRVRTLDALCELLVGHARQQPVCLVIEDVHEIEAETRTLVDRMIDRIVDERVLIILTSRPDHAYPWSAHGHYAQVPMQPLPQDDAAELLVSLLGRGPELPALVELLLERSEGNPLFIESSVSELIDAEALVGHSGAYRLRQPITAIHVPSTVQALLAARIDRLADDDRLLLQCAATIGKDVPVDFLATVTGLPAAEFLDRLDTLVRRGLLYDSGAPSRTRVSFTHGLVLEVAIGALVRETRRALHLRILEALEHGGADVVEDRIERLAHHAVRAEAWDRAVRYCRDAGALAYQRSAHAAAVEHFERAVDAVRHLPESRDSIADAIDVRLELRAALIALGKYHRTVEHLREAEMLARVIDDERRLATIASHLANYLHLTGQLEAAVAQAEQALAIAERLGDIQLQRVTAAYLGFAQHTLGRYREAADLARRNIRALAGPQELERFGMTSLPAVYSRTCLAWALAELGDFDEAQEAGDQALALAERAAHSYSAVYGGLAAGVPRLRRGDVAAALPLFEGAHRLCHAHAIRALLSIVTIPLASCYARVGRIDDALRVLHDAAARAGQIRDPIGHWVRTGALAEVYLAAGQAADALPLARQYLEQRRAIGARGYEAWAWLLLAEVTSAIDPLALEPATEQYRQAITLADSLGMRPLAAMCRLGLGRLWRGQGGDGEVQSAIRTAAREFGAMRMTSWLHAAQAELGRSRQ